MLWCKKLNRDFKDKVTLVLFFDVEGEFDKARTSNICNALKLKKAPVSVINWVRSAWQAARPVPAWGENGWRSRYGAVHRAVAFPPAGGVWLWTNS